MVERCPDKTEVEGSIPSGPTMNKKFLIIALLIIVILVAGVFAYKYFNAQKTNVQNEVKVEVGDIKINPSGGGGGVIICQEKCGDNVCQATEAGICAETPQECPQDCK